MKNGWSRDYDFSFLRGLIWWSLTALHAKRIYMEFNVCRGMACFDY